VCAVECHGNLAEGKLVKDVAVFQGQSHQLMNEVKWEMQSELAYQLGLPALFEPSISRLIILGIISSPHSAISSA